MAQQTASEHRKKCIALNKKLPKALEKKIIASFNISYFNFYTRVSLEILRREKYFYYKD